MVLCFVCPLCGCVVQGSEAVRRVSSSTVLMNTGYGCTTLKACLVSDSLLHLTFAESAARLRAFRSACLSTEEQDGLIQLPEGVDWPQLGSVPLFVRYFYDDCYSGPLQSFTGDPAARYRKFVIMGNPGSEYAVFPTLRRPAESSLIAAP